MQRVEQLDLRSSLPHAVFIFYTDLGSFSSKAHEKNFLQALIFHYQRPLKPESLFHTFTDPSDGIGSRGAGPFRYGIFGFSSLLFKQPVPDCFNLVGIIETGHMLTRTASA